MKIQYCLTAAALLITPLSAQTFPDDWAYSQKLVLNTAPAGADVPGDVSDFPVLVRLNGGNFDFAQAQPDGGDVRFADAQESLLKHQVAEWDNFAGQAELWVLMPQVFGNNPAQFIRMYWGNSAAASASDPPGVFDVQNSFQGVWHYNNSLNDATANANNVTDHNGSSGAAGIIGGGRDFESGSSQYVSVPYNAALDMGAFTVSAWTRLESTGTRGILGTRIGGSKTFDFKWETNEIHGDIGDGNDWLTITADYSFTPSTNTWYHVAYVVDPTGYKIYLDGSEVVGDGYFGSGTPRFMKPDQSLGIGYTGYGSEYFDGIVDEVRVSSTTRSADWIKLAYENQNAAQSLVEFVVEEEEEDLSQWAYSQNLILNTSSSGAAIGSDVYYFPLLVRLNLGNFDFSQANSDGSDLRFANSSGALSLPHEIESWDAAAKKAEIWVLVDQVLGDNATQSIRMYWGKPGAASRSSASMVFGTQNGFQGVWHLDDDPSGGAGAILDATANAYHGDPVNLGSGDLVPARIGKGLDFDGATQFVDLGPNVPKLKFTSHMTVSAWVQIPSWKSGWQTILSKQYGTGHGDNWYFCLKENEDGVLNAGRYGALSQPGEVNTGPNSISPGNWYYLAGRKNGTEMAIYLNGVKINSATGPTSLLIDDQEASIGAQDNGNPSIEEFFLGIIDEVRAADVARSDGWIKLAYETQKESSTAISFGPVIVQGAFLPLAGGTMAGTIDMSQQQITGISNLDAARVITKKWRIIPPDFVFHEDYDLPSLAEIEEYVQSNGHLPEIPSAEQLQSEGMDIGTFNLLLLQKIEELTVHTIEQEKRIRSLESARNR